MKSTAHRTMPVLLPLFLCVVVACSGKKDGGPEGETARDLRRVGMAMMDYEDSKRKGASKVEELAPFLENDEKLIQRIRSGDIVVIWNVSFAELSKTPGGSASYVIAYEKDALTKGGLVVMGDAAVTKVSAEEFKTLKMADAGK